MSYIGNQPYTAAFLVDTKSGDGTTTAFTLTIAPANTSSIIVAITGVLQDPSTYSVSGTTLTFSAAPPSGTSNISVRYLGIPASGVTTTAYRTVTNTTATAGQTSFTIPSYTVGYVDVYRNGVYLPTSDYTATTGTTVVLTNAATAGDTITTISFYVSSVLNAIPNSPASVNSTNLSSNLTLGGTTTATTITAPASTALTLQSNNGTTGVTLSTSGYVNMPLVPRFSSGSSSNTNGTTLAGYYAIGTSSPACNVGSCFSTSTYLFTCPIAGYYRVYVGISSGDTQQHYCAIAKNGSISSPNALAYSQFTSSSLEIIFSCSAGDTLGAVSRYNTGLYSATVVIELVG